MRNKEAMAGHDNASAKDFDYYSPIVFFHSTWSTEAEQRHLHSVLPVAHDYGDKRSVLRDGSTIAGRAAHDALVNPQLRMRCRKRATLVSVHATHAGINRVPLKDPIDVLLCFSATPDWHAVGLDVEAYFLRPVADCDPKSVPWVPRIGPYVFNFSAFMSSVYEDLALAFGALKATFVAANATEGPKRKLHLKLVPLGVGPTIRTRFGDYLAPLVMPVYVVALQYACNTFVHESWIDTLEFVDHTRGQISPMVNVRNVRVISGSSRDAFDFTGSHGAPAIVAPCDAFCTIGGRPEDRNLAATLANNSNLRERMQLPYGFRACP